ncbi:hypothetical protein B0A55_09175 [Friedmanniomyces simplex]|uniref:Uncharacterized protein n=1 Tax=Friedmanniomyces simplex TaxID=329884 RepID=A0A4U0WV97_9PEZI|nr:hypothetical protein B0A55_09175 [Friedmanniomyces simplex]
MDNSRLRRFSPELRNPIYELVLHDPEGFRIFQYDGTHPDTGEPDGRPRGIDLYYNDRFRVGGALNPAKTCKEIRTQALPLFYHLNTFTLCYSSDSHSVGAWSSQMKTTYAASLTLKCYQYEYDRHGRRNSTGRGKYMCHLDVQKECSVVIYDLPSHDKKLARAAIEAAYEEQVAKIEERAVEYECCIGVGRMKDDLLDGADVGRTLMLQAVGK